MKQESRITMIKLIATDIDGTLVKDGTLLLNPEYLTVIDRLIDQGCYFVICSGRQFLSERKLFAPIKDRLLYISDGGAVVRTPKEIIRKYTMPEEIWKGMYRMVRDTLPSCDCYIGLPDYGLAEDAKSRMFRWLKDSYGFDIRETEDLMKLSSDDVIGLSVYHPTSCEEICRPAFIPAWQDKTQIAVAGKEWVDCNPLGVSKWTALSALIEYLGIAPDEVCAFGDNFNDIEMLQAAGLSFAVSNARSEVIESAREICPPYWEDGVLQILESRFLK